MKRSILKPGKGFKPRTTPMARGTSTLKQGAPLKSGGQLARQAKPMRSRSKTNSDPRPATGEAQLCRGQPCYLNVPGIYYHPVDTVVPCHSNAQRHGKGKGIKAHDKFTVPGCMHCHMEIDQGKRFTREEKFAIWDNAYERWEPVRDALLAAQAAPTPSSVSVAP